MGNGKNGLWSLGIRVLPLPSSWTRPSLSRRLCPQLAWGRTWEEVEAQPRAWGGCGESQRSLRLHPKCSWGCTFGSAGLGLRGCGYLHCRIQPPGKAKITLSSQSRTLLILCRPQVKKKDRAESKVSCVLIFKSDSKFANNSWHLLFDRVAPWGHRSNLL